jgi:opacity protein-like surface antigen
MKVLMSLACAGLAVAAAPTSAADLLGTSPPLTITESQGPTMFEIGTNWYVRGDLGVSFDKAPSVSFSNVALPPLGVVGAPFTTGDGARWTTTNFTGGAGFGYRWNDWLRFDATWDYRNGPGGTSQTTLVCPYGLTGVNSPAGIPLGYLYNTTNTCNGPASLRQYDNAFLGNAYIDLGTYYGFTPYVGGGLGLNMNVLSGSANFNETANGAVYAANLTSDGAFPQVWVNSQGQPITPQPSIAFAPQFWNRSIHSTTYTMAWALAAGIGFKLNPSATLDLGYRYLNTGTVNTLINPQTGLTIHQSNSSQQFLVGVRYYLQ